MLAFVETDKPFQKGDWWFRVCKSKTEPIYVAFAKKDKFIYEGLDIFINEPGELRFEHGETWEEAFLSLLEEVDENIKEYCTCSVYNWPEQVCPYGQEILENNEDTCSCCPYCYQRCLEAI